MSAGEADVLARCWLTVTAAQELVEAKLVDLDPYLTDQARATLTAELDDLRAQAEHLWALRQKQLPRKGRRSA